MKISKQNTKKIQNKNYLLLTILFSVFIVVFSLYYFNKNKTTTKSLVDSQKITIQNTPKAPVDNPSTESETKEKDTHSNVSADSISITVSYAGQDNPGGPLYIRTVLSNSTTGKCSYTISKEITKNYYSDIEFLGTYYSCNYTIPFSDLSTGDWNLIIYAQGDDGSVGKASQVINIRAY